MSKPVLRLENAVHHRYQQVSSGDRGVLSG